MKLILKYLKKYKLLVLLNVISVFGFALVELGIPTIMAKVIDIGIVNKDISYIKRSGTYNSGNFYSRSYGNHITWILFFKDF